MSETLEKLVEAPLAVRAGILLGVVGLIAGVYWFMFYQELQDELTKTEEESNKVQAEISEKQKIAANLPKFEAEVARLDVELKKALAELPDQKEIPQLLEKIADKAKESGLDVRLFKPKTEQRKDFYAEVPVEIEIGGGFHQVATFFDEVSKLERIVNINEFSMTDPKVGENGRNLKSSLVATSFRFLDEKERPKAEGAGGKRRKKRRSSGGDES